MPVLKLVQGICTLNPIAIVFLCCQNYFILSSSMDKTVRLWHISRRECLCCFQHIDFVTAIAFHPKVVDLFTVTATGHYTIPITHTPPFSGPFPGLPGWASTRKVKPIWILLKQETVSGSGITWTICSRQITMPAPHHSVFYWPSCRPTNSVKALKASLSAAYLL